MSQCYKCVDACGEQWQNTFAIAMAGRGFDARISTEFANPLPDSACVYCGNCVKVTSSHESSVTHGNLCIKGRFGWQHVQNR
ncbi:hypothetical protein ACIQUM_26775 [Amycolatopsis azurea]|uniref:hypothetical protein n=1 Tax=Amycolatopsis azurea TaxID=36819 RepID=UPI0037F7A1B5